MLLRLAILAALLLPLPALGQDLSSSSSPEPSPPILSRSDTDLELVVRAAYNGAAAFAAAHGNYFARDDAFAPLRDAVSTELLEEGFGSVAVPTTAAADLPGARACLAVPGTELRIVTSTYGDGLSLVAVTDRRDFIYHYDPHEDAAIKITPAEDCIKPN
jgi:hypothetical protein